MYHGPRMSEEMPKREMSRPVSSIELRRPLRENKKGRAYTGRTYIKGKQLIKIKSLARGNHVRRDYNTDWRDDVSGLLLDHWLEKWRNFSISRE